MDHHDEAVAVIARRVRQFYNRKEAFRIYHGSTNSPRKSAFERGRMIDTSGLFHILNVNTERRTALVEPNVPMDRLVEATLLHGLVPPVVMEFPGITVGGGFAGTAGESSSFKHGFFDRTFKWMEIVLANGDVVECSDTERRDLFHGAAGCFGTLGVATLFEIRLLEAKEYVELTYHPMTSVSEAIQKIGMETEDLANDYVDGIVFSLNKAVVMTGRLTNDVRSPSDVRRFFRAQDPWFYLHAKELLSKSLDPVTEVIPLIDYLFRYDRGAFWTGVYAFEYFVTPFNRITRWALDTFMRTRVMYHALHESGHSQRYMIQDLALPFSTAQEFIEYVDDMFGVITPSLSSDKGKDREHPGMLLNVGVWGPGSSRYEEFVHQNRMLEDKVQELDGMKWLYAHAYYTEDEFWSIYDRQWYDALRAKYNATWLPSVYDKVKVDVQAQLDAQSGSWVAWSKSMLWSIWPLSGLWGVYKAFTGQEYLMPR
ncbi:hypothetical protein LTR04_000738 [Oleoguttula sp. CCFEE 6159]|nr:hypothetical protein LTR04_000738 [Oleoguttula sp. CCFEE 6159]